MTSEQIREFAKVGALEQARRAIVEFPEILAELNRLAAGNGSRPRGRFAGLIDEAALAEAAAQKPQQAELPGLPAKRKHRISAAGRRRISVAMKARWAASKKASR